MLETDNYDAITILLAPSLYIYCVFFCFGQVM